ncbi:MAG: hypothetical protein N3B21_06400 [Clostridia bacterium]|nr:hypothetical protein [Clostridia bacterium]
MRRARPIKEITGRVFFDINNNGIMDNYETGLVGIGVNVFFIDDIKREKIESNKGEIIILKEKLIYKTRTDKNGVYRLLVEEGNYCIGIDIDSLPEGVGVVEANRLLPIGSRAVCDFAVREIASIELLNYLRDGVELKEEVAINPVIKDKQGNILAARVSCSSDSRDAIAYSGGLRLKPCGVKNKRININIRAGGINKQYAFELKIPEMSSVDKIHHAYRNGFIDESNKIALYMYLLFDKRRLPEEYRSSIPIKSGTAAVEEILEYIGRRDTDKAIGEEARRYINGNTPKLDMAYTSPSGFFKIHYTTSGPNAVHVRERNRSGVPPYIQAMGEAFDNVKSITCGQRGFRTPILDPGKSSFDVYVYDLKGKYGVTFASNYYNGQSLGRNVASSYICMDNNYSPEKGFDKSTDECMKVTAAHEFFHAVQYAYNVKADNWWKEATATWNEDEIYTGVNDYIRYLKGFFSQPNKSLEKSSYGGVIFAKYLAENMDGHSFIKRIWEIQSNVSGSIEAIDRAIKEKYAGGDIGTVFNRFTACNYYPVQYYKEGALWGTAVMPENTYSAYPVADARGQLEHLSASYQLFKSSESMKGKALRIVVDGADEARWGFKVQKRLLNDDKCYLSEITSEGRYNRAEIVFTNFGDNYKEVCFIPANLEKNKDDLQYIYSATLQ